MKKISKANKGEYGYIDYSVKKTIIRSVISVGLTVAIFLTGLFRYGSNRNVFSIIAAIGCLPAGWSVVNMIMFLRSGRCSENAHEEIEKHKGGLFIQYDLEMTSEAANYSISAVTVLEKNVCAITEDPKLDIEDCEKHIRLQIGQSGYSDYTVKVFDDLNKFCLRLDQLENLRESNNIHPEEIEEAWVPGTTQTPAAILCSISL